MTSVSSGALLQGAAWGGQRVPNRSCPASSWEAAPDVAVLPRVHLPRQPVVASLLSMVGMVGWQVSVEDGGNTFCKSFHQGCCWCGNRFNSAFQMGISSFVSEASVLVTVLWKSNSVW